MARVYNFAAGPGVMPVPVLEKAAREMVEHGKNGMSVMEMSHRSKMFEEIIGAAETNLRSLMSIPDNYKVLFLQGGASLQFAMVPLNLMHKSFTADYYKTGSWGKAAAKEAARYGKINIVANSEDKNFSYVPGVSPDAFSKDADYVHLTTNETIYGTRIQEKDLPATGEIPLVADMSSNILSEEYDVKKFGLIYAGAQKNMGPAGLTTVIIREDLIGLASEKVPAMLNYKTQADNASMYNTPPTYAVYMAGLVFEWLKEQGGVAGIHKINEAKAKLLYDFLDGSKLFKGTAEKKDRSIMNVCFVLPNAELDEAFLAAAKARALVNLKGHRSVGGMRASIYNAMPIEGIQTLVACMKEFEAQNK